MAQAKKAQNKPLTPKQVMENFKKSFGKDFLCKASEIEEREIISTSYEQLDKAIGVGGIPLGIIVELFGPEASGKGVVSLNICGQAQKEGLKAMWVDAENQFNKQWASINGVDVEELFLMRPLLNSAESVFESIQTVIESKMANIIIIDSLASLTPKIEIEKDMGDTQVGRMGAIMSTALRKLTPLATINNCTIIFINQVRTKIGVMFGNPETTPGGKSLGHYASLRIRIKKTNNEILRDGEKIGIKSKIKIHKNRFGMPFKEAEIPIYHIEYNPTPFEAFADAARECNAIIVRNDNYYFDGMAGESPIDVLKIVIEQNRSKDFADKFIEKVEKKKDFSLEKLSSDIHGILELMKNDKIKLEDFEVKDALNDEKADSDEESKE